MHSGPIKRQALASDSDSEETFVKEADFHTLKRNFNLNRNTSDNVIHAESEDKETQTEWPHQHDQKGPLF